jgi:hypothetical protein
MNGMEAVVKVAKLTAKVDALNSVIGYVNPYDWQDEIETLSEMKKELQAELDVLTDKLRSVQL